PSVRGSTTRKDLDLRAPVHAGRFHPSSASIFLTQPQGLDPRFYLQQQPLALQPPTIAAKMPRCADGSMTRNNNRHWICAIGCADGADGARPADAPRDFGIRARLARRDREKLLPHRKLKRSSAYIHRRGGHLRAARNVVGAL